MTIRSLLGFSDTESDAEVLSYWARKALRLPSDSSAERVLLAFACWQYYLPAKSSCRQVIVSLIDRFFLARETTPKGLFFACLKEQYRRDTARFSFWQGMPDGDASYEALISGWLTHYDGPQCRPRDLDHLYLQLGIFLEVRPGEELNEETLLHAWLRKNYYLARDASDLDVLISLVSGHIWAQAETPADLLAAWYRYAFFGVADYRRTDQEVLKSWVLREIDSWVCKSLGMSAQLHSGFSLPQLIHECLCLYIFNAPNVTVEQLHAAYISTEEEYVAVLLRKHLQLAPDADNMRVLIEWIKKTFAVVTDSEIDSLIDNQAPTSRMLDHCLRVVLSLAVTSKTSSVLNALLLRDLGFSENPSTFDLLLAMFGHRVLEAM